MELAQLKREDTQKMYIEKLNDYCEKINKYFVAETTSDEDSGCSNCKEESSSDQIVSSKSSDEIANDERHSSTKHKSSKNAINTLREVLKEKQQMRTFAESFVAYANKMRPESTVIASCMKHRTVDASRLNQIIAELDESLVDCKYQCHCFSGNHDEMIKRSNELAIKVNDENMKIEKHHLNQLDLVDHRPSVDYLINCVYMFQSLFDVDCYLKVPEKINELYYKYNELELFRKDIQCMFDPSMIFNKSYNYFSFICITLH